VQIYIVIYTTYGHVFKMAEKVKEGVDAVDGCEAKIYQVPETLPAEVLEKMHAPPKPDVPIITADELKEADGILFGVPTRFGMIPAQMKAFLDSTGGLWQSGALVGKPAGIFFSTATQGGGQETTALTFVTQLAHHGMIFVPTGYISPAEQFNMEEIMAGSAYGAGTFAGADGSRMPSAGELNRALAQGKSFSAVAKKLSA